MENQAKSRNTIINYGLIFGFISVLSSLTLWGMNMHLSESGAKIGFAVLALSIIIIPILGIKSYKKQNGGYLSWGQALKVGVGIVVLGTLISIIYNRIFTGVIEPDYYTQVEELQRQAYFDSGMTEDQIDAQLEMQSKFQGTLVGDASGLLFFTFIGFVISAIAGAIMKKDENTDY